MPLDKFVLILVIVLAAAGLTVWVATFVAAAYQLPVVWTALLPAGLVAYVVWRVISERLRNRDDDKYDRIEK